MPTITSYTTKQAILSAAGPRGTAAVRAAGRGAAAAAGEAAPSLRCELTAASTADDAAAWLRATRRLAHAPELALTLHGAVAAAPVEALFAGLARRGAVPRLLLVRGGGGGGNGGDDGGNGGGEAAAASTSAAAAVPAASLPAKCLARLPAGVRALKLSGVALRLDAITGGVEGGGSGHIAAGAAEATLPTTAAPAPETTLLAGLAEAPVAASLATLDLGAGWAGPGAALQYAAAAIAALAALPRLERFSVTLPPPALAQLPPALAGLAGGDAFVGPQLRDAAAGAVAALLCLTRLVALSVAGLPDVWAPRYAGAAAAAAAGAVADGNAAADADGADAAAAPLPLLPHTFEGLGARLASGLPALRRLDVALAGGWGLAWRAAADDGALTLAAVDAAAHLAPRGRAAAGSGAAAAAAAAAAGAGDLRTALEVALAPYVDAPTAALPLVRSLRLALPLGAIAGLERTLRALPALASLRVAVMATAAAAPAAPLGALLAAVAAGAGPRLAELAVVLGLAPAVVSPAALEPLAARLPGLRALRIAGALRAADGTDAWATLARVRGLRRLALHNVAAAKAPFAPEAALPPALEAVDLKGLRLVAVAAAAAPAAVATGETRPLRSVRLVGCDASATGLAAPGLAGAAVADATVVGCALGPAGWAAAADAWPRLESLRAALAPAATTEAQAEEAAGLLAGALPRMRALEAVALPRLPRLGDAEIAALLLLAGVRRVSVGAAACEVTRAGAEALVAAAAAEAKGAGGAARLRSLSLQLPARHLLPPGVRAVLGDGSGEAAAAVAAPWWAEPSDGGVLCLARLLRAAAPTAAIDVALSYAPLGSVARGGGGGGGDVVDDEC